MRTNRIGFTGKQLSGLIQHSCCSPLKIWRPCEPRPARFHAIKSGCIWNGVWQLFTGGLGQVEPPCLVWMCFRVEGVTVCTARRAGSEVTNFVYTVTFSVLHTPLTFQPSLLGFFILIVSMIKVPGWKTLCRNICWCSQIHLSSTVEKFESRQMYLYCSLSGYAQFAKFLRC